MIDKAMRIKGKVSRRELLTLYQWAAQAPEGAAVEVGALHGRSMLVWTEARRGRGEMLVVDDAMRESLLSVMPADVVACHGLSWEFASKMPPLAFCFIDADHGIDAFPKDLVPYAAKMIPGGIIAFHDYDPCRPEFAVREYVDDWQSMVHWEYLGLVGSLIAFRRPA